MKSNIYKFFFFFYPENYVYIRPFPVSNSDIDILLTLQQLRVSPFAVFQFRINTKRVNSLKIW